MNVKRRNYCIIVNRWYEGKSRHKACEFLKEVIVNSKQVV